MENKPKELDRRMHGGGGGTLVYRGGSRIFIGGGGGGAKDYNYAPMHITSANPKVPYSRGPGPLKGPGSSRGFDVSPRAIWALFF